MGLVLQDGANLRKSNLRPSFLHAASFPVCFPGWRFLTALKLPTLESVWSGKCALVSAFSWMTWMTAASAGAKKKQKKQESIRQVPLLFTCWRSTHNRCALIHLVKLQRLESAGESSVREALHCAPNKLCVKDAAESRRNHRISFRVALGINNGTKLCSSLSPARVHSFHLQSLYLEIRSNLTW